MRKKRAYIADRSGLHFTIVHDPRGHDQPWSIWSDLVQDTHHTLDELLFWNLVIVDPTQISRGMRQSILTDFGQEVS